MPTKTTEEHSPICYPAQHMSLQEYAVYEVSMRLTSGGANPLYLDGRKMAGRFGKASRSGIYRAVESLVDKGWFEPDNDKGKKVDPTSRRYTATRYTLVTHDRWIIEHGDGECIDHHIPVPYLGTESQTDIEAQKSKLRDRLYSALQRLQEIALNAGCLSESFGLVCLLTADPDHTAIYCASSPLLHRMVDDIQGAQSNPVPNSPVPSTGAESVPVPKLEGSSPKSEAVQSQNREIPVPPAGHSLVFNSVSNSVKDNSVVRSSSQQKVSSARPTIEEVTQYCQERHNAVDPQKWFDHYSANGWKVGRNPMKDWRAAVRTWERNGVVPLKQSAGKPSRHADFSETDYTKGLQQKEDGSYAF
jgi:hypothetical protein